MTIVRNHWVTDTKKLQIKGRLTGLRATAQHLVGHIQEANVDDETLVEMHEHMEHMDLQLSSFHEQVENAAAKWRRSRPTSMASTHTGDKVPFSLVIPVVFDCFLDGMLIGVACCLSPAGGIILGVANSLEMIFLGIAYATRLAKCTGSSEDYRSVITYFPPFFIFLGAGLGGWVADASSLDHHPALFVGYTAFVAVILMALVCGELLVQAKEAQGESTTWWVNSFILVGVYGVLVTDRAIMP